MSRAEEPGRPAFQPARPAPPGKTTRPLDGPEPGPQIDKVPASETAVWVSAEGAWRQGIVLGRSHAHPSRAVVQIATAAGIRKWVLRVSRLRLRSAP